MIRRYFILCLLAAGILTSCNKEALNGVPGTTVNFSILVGDPFDTALLTVGGWEYVASEGYAGVIVICNGTNTFLAYDLGCPYDCSSNPQAILQVQKDNVTLACPVCGSSYSMYTGKVIKGPGSLPLEAYATNYHDRPTLEITNY